MLTYVVGDLFQSPSHVLVNTVNTVGVMGKGIAKTFKMIYPEMFEKYRRLCEAKKLTVGKVWLYKTPNKWILNFPTKTTWRQPSRMEYIESGLSAFVRGYAERGITSIAFPALGCGNGELSWNDQVRPLMEKYLRPLPIDIFIYVYKRNSGIPEHKNVKPISDWLRKEPESLSFSEVWLDMERIIGSGITLKSFYGDRSFHVERSEAGKGIQIDVEDRNEYIYDDELLDFWNVLRSYGFGFPAVMPAGIEPYMDFLLALFAELPYCRKIFASKSYKNLDTLHARGIQFFPRSAEISPLFNETPRHLVAV